MNNDLVKQTEFVSEIYNSLVLSHYIKHWGMPESRVVSKRQGFDERIAVYYFPCNKEKPIAHVATIGTSQQTGRNGKVGCEYIFVLPCDLGGADIESVYNYLLDISAHTVINIEDISTPRVMGESKLAPAAWKTKAILFDELRGEDENFSTIPYGDLFNTKFIWAVPIHESEYKSITENGIEFFDSLEQLSEISIVDVTRAPFC
ncbi:suppressor of fused domain protein [Chitinophaga niastensis]|nr:suppressor of fused domain protein [Chitinophaga niastensis]